MSGGAYKNNNNLLGRHREMENLEKEVQAQRDRMRGIVKEQEEGRQEAKELQDAMENNRKIRQELILKQNTAKINYDRAKGDFLRIRMIWITSVWRVRESIPRRQSLPVSLMH